MKENIKASTFVKRQTKGSSFSYFDGSWERLEELVKEHFDNYKLGYREGVVLVTLPADDFYTSIVEVSEGDELETEVVVRQPGEDPFLKTVVLNKAKEPAKVVKVVLYHKDVLAEDDDRSTDADWEIISINADPMENVPMHPLTMARNELHLKGGTQAEYFKEEYLDSIVFWASHANVKGSEE